MEQVWNDNDVWIEIKNIVIKYENIIEEKSYMIKISHFWWYKQIWRIIQKWITRRKRNLFYEGGSKYEGDLMKGKRIGYGILTYLF